jgi:hypothetical protein
LPWAEFHSTLSPFLNCSDTDLNLLDFLHRTLCQYVGDWQRSDRSNYRLLVANFPLQLFLLRLVCYEQIYYITGHTYLQNSDCLLELVALVNVVRKSRHG